ncbi:MAG: hypothetical protein QOE58_2417 [Actinomycetota bacterium]|jgi:SAM-dependent methyltransferase|nr:hypothetical protein [Actinomycetota bacterium]
MPTVGAKSARTWRRHGSYWIGIRLGRLVTAAAVGAHESRRDTIKARLPGVDVHSGVAEHLPFPVDSFDLALAQLVVPFMTDPVSGLREMARVTRPGGLVAACVWDHAGGASPLTTFWQAVHDVTPGTRDEAEVAGAREGHLAELCEAAGLKDLEPTTLSVSVRFTTFADWWEPFTLGVGPAGAHVAQLDDGRRNVLKAQCAQLLPPTPFAVTASAWCVSARI